MGTELTWNTKPDLVSICSGRQNVAENYSDETTAAKEHYWKLWTMWGVHHKPFIVQAQSFILNGTTSNFTTACYCKNSVHIKINSTKIFVCKIWRNIQCWDYLQNRFQGLSDRLCYCIETIRNLATFRHLFLLKLFLKLWNLYNIEMKII